MIKEVWINL